MVETLVLVVCVGCAVAAVGGVMGRLLGGVMAHVDISRRPEARFGEIWAGCGMGGEGLK